MGLLSNILGSGLKEIVSTVSGVVDEFTLSPEEKARLNQEMQRLVLEQFQAVEASVQARFAMVKEIIAAEMSQGDNFTKRARPTVVYVGLVLFAVQVLAQLFPGVPHIEVPVDFTIAWASIVGVWSVGRSYEKGSGKTNVISRLATGSDDSEELKAPSKTLLDLVGKL
jgi:Protein of unknown function (DUF3154).